MINHMPFDPSNPELKELRRECFRLCTLFNRTSEDYNLNEAEKTKAFRKIVYGDPDSNKPAATIGMHVGDNIDVQAPFHCDYGFNLHIGDNVDIGRNCYIADACSVKVERNVIIGPNVQFLAQDGDHHPNPPLMAGQKRLAKGMNILVHEDAYIGGGSIIYAGVQVGAGATIPPGTVVDQVSPCLVHVQEGIEGLRNDSLLKLVLMCRRRA